ncbi:hypothetical protein LT493_25825 [Streptomyces tricolor]|nr:hypothetical protein [Streptomyces tricolor]
MESRHLDAAGLPAGVHLDPGGRGRVRRSPRRGARQSHRLVPRGPQPSAQALGEAAVPRRGIGPIRLLIGLAAPWRAPSC